MSLFFYTTYLFWISLYSKPMSKAMEGWTKMIISCQKLFVPWRVGNNTHQQLDLCDHAYPVLDFFFYLSFRILCHFLLSKLFESSGISITFHFSLVYFFLPHIVICLCLKESHDLAVKSKKTVKKL